LRSAPEQKLPPAPVRIEGADVGVGVGLDTGVVEAHEHLAVDGVLSFRTVQRDDERVAIAFGQKSRHGRRG
jgi:hypothetical protein